MSGVDALVWVMNSEAAAGDRVEVHQVWGDLLVEVRQMEADAPIYIGSTPGWRWRLLGIDMGRLPALAARALPWALPVFAEAVSAPKADFEVPNADLPDGTDHVLVRDGHVRVADGWEGFVDQDGERRTFDLVAGTRRLPGGLEVPLHPGSRVVVEIAGQVFQIRRTAADKRAAARFHADPGLVGVLGLVGALFAAVFAAAPGVHSATVNAELPDPIVQVAEMVPTPAVAQPAEGPRARDDAGRTGERKADQKEARGGKRTKSDREIASAAGLLSASPDDSPGLSADLRSGIGGLIGARGSRIGSGGLGNRGSGLGGDGTADDMGGLGLSGASTGRAPSLGSKQEGTLATSSSEVVTIGSLDKSLIEKVIHQHLSQIRYCYQRELNRNPVLSGKHVVKFTIGHDGRVTSATTKASTLGSAAVESCINGRFQRMTFPAPSAGLVIVSYPFVFTRS